MLDILVSCGDYENRADLFFASEKATTLIRKSSCLSLSKSLFNFVYGFLFFFGNKEFLLHSFIISFPIASNTLVVYAPLRNTIWFTIFKGCRFFLESIPLIHRIKRRCTGKWLPISWSRKSLFIYLCIFSSFSWPLGSENEFRSRSFRTHRGLWAIVMVRHSKQVVMRL